MAATPPKAPEMQQTEKRRNHGRKKGKITKCPHFNLPLYAKGMCNHCYHKYGRSLMATDCAHANVRPIYARGKCQSCYINDYNKKRRRDKKLLEKQEELSGKALQKM